MIDASYTYVIQTKGTFCSSFTVGKGNFLFMIMSTVNVELLLNFLYTHEVVETWWSTILVNATQSHTRFPETHGKTGREAMLIPINQASKKNIEATACCGA